jgi:hypothetical protein
MQRSFAAGEIGPTLYGGADQNRYQQALATCHNFVIMRHGGATMRTGTQYVATVKNSANPTYLFKFVFSDSDTYLIEAGELYFRFHQKGAPVVIASPSAWSSVTAYVPGNFVLSGGTAYICIAANTNQTPPNATYWYALTASGSNWIVEVPTVFHAADLSQVKYIQAGNVVTFTHPSYQPQQLTRSSGNWSMTAFSTAPWAVAPSSTITATPGAAGSLNPKYVVTAQAQTTYEETTASASATCSSAATPTATAPNVITYGAAWSNATAYVAGNIVSLAGVVYICIAANTNQSPPNATYWAVVAQFNVYCDPDGNGNYGFIGTSSNTTFNDTGFTPDASVTPPLAQTLFNSSGNYPGCTTYYQQRQLFGGATNTPEQINTSRTAFFKNFTISNPIQDDDAITFSISGRQINEVRHLIEAAGTLIVLTRTGEWVVLGDADQVLRPTAINAHQQSYYGASHTIPVIVGSAILYVQTRQTLVRDFRLQEASQVSYYEGRDLTLYAPHLFAPGFTIPRMDFAQIPDSLLWCVRNDGVLLGLTYLRDQDIFGWHRHDTVNGAFEDVCTIPESMPRVAGSGNAPTPEDGVYVIVRRTIQGSTVRYIERLASRQWFDYRLDAIYLDCDLDYNGINPFTATTMTLSTAAGWTTSDLITVTASASTFDSGWVGTGVTVWDSNNPANVNRIVVTQYVSATVVKGNPIATVQASLQNAATLNWSHAVANLSGLTPLAGQNVTMLANGIVYTGTVSNTGTITNIDGAGGLYDVVHVGYPITAELETLDLDSDQQAIRDLSKLIRSVSVLVQNSRVGFQAGPDASHLLPYAGTLGTVTSTSIFSGSGGATQTTLVEVNLTATWSKPGRVHILQNVPLPLTVLDLMPNGPLGG